MSFTAESLAQKYSLDDVILLALKQSLLKKSIDYKLKSDALILSKILTPYDWALALGGTYKRNQANSSYFWSPVLSVQKKWMYGTQFQMSHSAHTYPLLPIPSSRLKQTSLPSYRWSLALKQSWFSNFFGYRDQLQVHSIQLKREALSLQRKEELKQLILQVAEQFWKAYTAHQKIRYAQKRITDYKKLREIGKEKFKIGYAKPAEIPQIQVQLEKAKLELAQAQVQFENAKSVLKSTLQLHNSSIQMKRYAVPSLPTNRSSQFNKSLNQIQLAQKNYQSQIAQLNVDKVSLLPNITTEIGVHYNDRSKNSHQFFSSLSYMSPQDYSFAVNFTYLFPSSKPRWNQWEQIQFKKIHLQSEYEHQKWTVKTQLHNSLKEINLLYKNVKSIDKISKIQKRTIKEIQQAYQQGRADIHALISIQDQDRQIELQKIETQKQYSLSLLRYYALRDELLKKYL